MNHPKRFSVLHFLSLSLSLFLSLALPVVASDGALQDFKAALNFSTADSREAAINRLLRQASASMMQQFYDAALEAESEEAKNGAIKQIASRWAMLDGPKALSIVAAIDSVDNETYRRILQAWSLRDPQGAIAWLNNNNERFSGDARDDMFLRLFMSWSISDFRTAADFALGLEDEFIFRCCAAYCVISSHLGKPDELQAWISEISADASHDPGRIQYLNETLVTVWVQRDADACIAWIQSKFEDPARKTEMSLLAIERWAQADSHAAANWVTAKVDTELGNPYFAAYSKGIAQNAPETALQWAASLTDDTLRTKTTDAIIGDWARRESRKATAWIEEQPDAQKEHFREIAQNARNKAAPQEKRRDISLGPIKVTVVAPGESSED